MKSIHRLLVVLFASVLGQHALANLQCGDLNGSYRFEGNCPHSTYSGGNRTFILPMQYSQEENFSEYITSSVESGEVIHIEQTSCDKVVLIIEKQQRIFSNSFTHMRKNVTVQMNTTNAVITHDNQEWLGRFKFKMILTPMTHGVDADVTLIRGGSVHEPAGLRIENKCSLIRI